MSKRLAKLKDEINKKYKGNYVVLAADPSAFEIQKLPTGVFALDVISYGGVPKGRISILWGEYSSGKTSAALSLVGRAQRTCRECLAFMQIVGVENSVIDEDSGEILVAHTGYDEAVNRLNAMEEYRNLSVEGKLPQKKEAEFEELTEWFNSSSLKDRKIRQVATKKYLCPKCGKADPLTAVWIDVEGVFERKWAANFHVDLESLWVARPTYAEQAVDIMNHIIRSGACDLIILDSVAAMVPTKEIEASAEKFQQGLGARIMNKAIRTWVAGISEAETSEEASTMPTIVLINQVRQKIGVMYGCFEYGAMVSLADGSRKKIGEIVKDKLPIDVLSVEDGRIVPRKVVGWHDNGPTDEWLKVMVSRPKTVSQFKCTPEHRVETPAGLTAAGDLRAGSKVLIRYKRSMSKDAENLILGMALGDGSLRAQGKVTATLRVEHSHKQAEYCRWKERLLGGLVSSSRESRRGSGRKVAHSFYTKSSVEIGKLRRLLYTERGGKHYKRFNTRIAERLTPLGVAMWYLDDGSLNTRKKWGKDRCYLAINSFDENSKRAVVKFFVDRGMECALYGGQLFFTVEGTRWLQKEICKFVPPSMQHKLSEGFRGKYLPPPVDLMASGDGLVESEVLKIEKVTTTSKGNYQKPTRRYDLTIEGGAHYFVSDVLVHNSPDVMPGGKGQEFGNSLTIKLHGSKYAFEEDTGETQSRVIKATVTKSKVCPPREIAEYVLWLRSKDSHAAGSTEEPKVVMQQAMKEGVITKEKTTYFMAGKKYKTQKEMMACLVKDDMLLEEVRSATLEAMSARKLRSAT